MDLSGLSDISGFRDVRGPTSCPGFVGLLRSGMDALSWRAQASVSDVLVGIDIDIDIDR